MPLIGPTRRSGDRAAVGARRAGSGASITRLSCALQQRVLAREIRARARNVDIAAEFSRRSVRFVGKMLEGIESEMTDPHGPKASARALHVAAIAVLIAPVSACSSSDSFNPFNLFGGDTYKTTIVPDVPAEDLYNQGLARLEKKDYDGAAKKFGELEKQYPYSQWQRKGLLMTTFSQFQNGSYDDAIASAQRYIGLYPTSPDIAYAYYLAGMSNYNQIPDISRDQARAAKAATFFTQIVEKFPKSEYAEDARTKLQVTRDQLAGKEMLVGRYYLEQHNYPAAINRFREVLAKYQTTRHAEEALMRLTEAYLALGITNEAQTAAAVLGHNFPDSAWYKDAYARLQKGGLEPQEDKESWISKAFRKFGLG
jgi:outer membrane protein assembly factor BamD